MKYSTGKQHYGDTLISVASNKKIPLPVLSTTMCAEKRALKERLSAIMKSKKHTKLTVLLSAIIFLAVTLTACAVVADGGNPAPAPPPEPTPHAANEHSATETLEPTQPEQAQEFSHTEDLTATEGYAQEWILGRWILESAVVGERVQNGEAASIHLQENGSFSIQPYAASGGVLSGSFELRENILTLKSTELAHGESPEIELRNEVLTLMIDRVGGRITANDNFAFYRSPYYFFREGDVFIKSPGF